MSASNTLRHRLALRKAVAPIIEALEQRRLMSTTLVTGADAAVQGTPYTLALNVPSQGSGVTWSINWGDGVIDAVPGTAASATHTYTTSATSRTIAASLSSLPNPLDTSFGTVGKSITDLGTGDDYPYDVALQPDGKLLVVGGPSFSVARYNANGTLDESFGSNGTVSIPGVDSAYGIALQSDGKILVGGGSNFTLARFTADGSLDTTFGTGGTAVSGFGVTYRAYDFAQLEDGKIVAVGTNNGTNFIVARFNANGSVDTSFGTSGKTSTDFFGALDKAFALAVQSDGKLVVVGQARDGATNYKWAIARYTAAGALDTSFGTGGKVTTDFGHNDDAAWSVQLRSDGKIVVAGRGGSASTGYDFGLAQYNTDGSLDTAFGSGGTTTLDFGAGGDQAYALRILSDSKLLLTGRAQSSSNAMDFGLARFNANGTLDTTFGNSGKVRTDFRGSTDQGEAAVVLPNGDVVVAGGSSTVGSGGATDFALARYHLDTSATKTISVSADAQPFLVPGAIGTMTTVSFKVTDLPFSALYRNELGLYFVDNTSYDIGSVHPSDPTYTSTALTDPSRQVVFPRGTSPGDTYYFTLPAGKLVAFYMVQDATTANYLNHTFPSNYAAHEAQLSHHRLDPTRPNVFFLNVAANFDGYAHFRSTPLPDNGGLYECEDLTNGGDQDFNDLVYQVGTISTPTLTSATGTASPPRVDLAWTSTMSGISGFEIERTVSGGSFSILQDITDPVARTYRDSTVVPGVSYAYRLRTYIAFGGTRFYSDYSAELTAGVTAGVPTATLSNGGPVDEGSSGIVSFSSVVGDGPFTYKFDFDNDGTFDVTGTTASVAVPAADLDDGPGSHTVRAQVVDSFGVSSVDYTTTITIGNVAPTVTITGPSSASANVTLSFTNNVSDPSTADVTAGFDYAWTVTKDGVSYTPGKPTDQATLAFAPTAAGTYVVSLAATDKDSDVGTSNAITVAVSPTGSGPTATFANNGPVNEGSSAVVTFSNQTGTGPFTYDYDFDNDGTFEITGSTLASATVPTAYLVDGPVTRVVAGRITDGSLTTSYTTTVTVNNVPPTLHVTGAATAEEGQVYTLNVSATDPGTDTISGWVVNWGDGSANSTASTPTAIFTHTFATGSASATLTVSAADEDGGPYAAAATIVGIRPAPPEDLALTAISSTQIDVTWTDASAIETGFILDRATDAGFTLNFLTRTIPTSAVLPFEDTGLTPSTTYYYRVRATNATGDSANTPVEFTTTPGPAVPADPTFLQATPASPSSIDLTWEDNAGNETGYFVEYTIDPTFGTGILTQSAAANAESSTVSGLSAGTTYYFRVKALGAVGDSNYSNTASAQTPAAGTPVAPTGLSAVGLSSDKVLLSWRDNSSNETGFEVRRSTSAAFSSFTPISLAAGVTNYIDGSGLSAGTHYYYAVIATGTTSSAPSNVAQADTRAASAGTISVTPGLSGDMRADLPGGFAPGADGGNATAMSYNGGAVRYSDGREFFSTTDIDPAEGGIVSGVTRTWSNDPVVTGTINGGWVLSQAPTLVRQDADTIAVIDGGRSVRWFDKVGAGWQSRFYNLDALVEDGSGTFVLTDTTGNSTSFAAFGASATSGATKYVDAGGNETTYTYTSGKLSTIDRKRGGTAGTVLERIAFSYDSVTGAITNIVVSRLNEFLSTPTLQVVRQAVYAYTGGQLRFVTIKDASGVDVEHKHYRYDASGRLKVVLEGASYERAKVGLPGAPESVGSDEALRTYADLFFEFNAAGQLTKQQMQGVGTYQYFYPLTTANAGLNEWASKTIEYLPDPSLADSWNDTNLADNDQNIVYSNVAGEVLLKSFKAVNVAGTPMWTTANQYDSAGRLTLAAAPSAIAGSVNEANADIVTPVLNTTAGMISINGYYGSASASPGYLQFTGVKQGTSGALNKQAEYVYGAQRPSSQGRLITSGTVYRGDAGTLPVTTTYAYTFTGNRVQSLTTTLPTVSTTQDGSGTTNTTVQTFDAFGHETQFTDGDGKVHTTAYADATGAIKDMVIDTGDLALETQIVSDGLGRTTKVTDPKGNVTLTAYYDTATVSEMAVTPPSTPISGGGNASPINVVRDDRAQGYLDTLSVVRGGTQIVSLTRSHFNTSQQIDWSDRYEDTVSGSGMTYTQAAGVQGMITRYRTEFGYDGRGRQVRVATDTAFTTSPVLLPSPAALTKPEITRTVYDSLDRPIQTWTGTDDSAFNPASTGAQNLTKITANEYNNGGVGDGNLTKVTQFPNDGSPDRVTAVKYDWRDRAVVTMSGVGSPTGTHPPITFSTYDNLNRVVSTRVYDGDGISFSTINIASIDTDLAANRRSYTETLYDDRGEVFRKLQHSVNPASGAVDTSGALSTNLWYDNRGNVIKSKEPGGLVTKTQYDGAGRATKQSITDGGGDSVYADAKNVNGDVVLEQILTQYDGNGNAMLVVTKQRDHNATALGDLSASNARVSLVGTWYDAGNGPVTSVNWGNNGDDGASFLSGGQYVRPTTAPARDATAITAGWDQWLRTDYGYDNAGRLSSVQYPRTVQIDTTTGPREDRYKYDSLGRQTQVLETYVNGAPDTVDADRQTIYKYDGLGHVVQQDSQTFGPISGGGVQPRTLVTKYTYGVTKDGTNTFVNDNALLKQTETYRSSGSGPEGLQTETITGYDALGEPTRKTMGNGSDHRYVYDALGHVRSDEIINFATLPASMDTSVRKLSYEFDALGRGVLFTTQGIKPTGGPVQILNQVKRQYDGLGNLTIEYQEQNGSVNTASSPAVRYVYDTNFGSNYSRLAQTVYPNGRALWTGYNDTTLNNAISRPGYLADSDYDGSGNPTAPQSTRLDSYAYLGLNQVVVRDMDKSASGSPGSGSYTLSYADLWLDPQKDDGGASDPYDGLDRFGRVVSHGWDTWDARTYAYDSDSNLLYAYAGTNIDSKWRSELYSRDSVPISPVKADDAYDRLGRLQQWQRGILDDQDSDGRYDAADTSTTISPLSVPFYWIGPSGDIETHYQQQFWDVTADTGGNYRQVPNSLGNYDPENPANRSTFQKQVPTGSFSLSGTQQATTNLFVQYDAWGRMTYKATATLRDLGSGTYTYDATTSTPKDVQTFAYDALGRRVTESRTVSTSTAAGTFRGTQHLYYDAAGNVLEERHQASASSPTTTVQMQYVWSDAGTGLLVVRDDDSSGGDLGNPGSGLGTRVWVEQGPDGSTWQIIEDGAGFLGREQFLYTPEGQVTVLDAQIGTFSYYDLILNDTQQITRSYFASPNGNTNFSSYGFRYLFHGGRAEVFADPSVATGNVIDKFDGLLSTRGGEHDTWRGAPLGEDVSAYARTNNTYDQWTPVATNYPGNGTSGFWNGASTTLDAWFNPEAYGAMAKTTLPNADDWWGNFGHAFFYSNSAELDYGAAARVTNPAWVEWTSRGLGLAGASLITVGTLGLGSGAAWASVGGMWGGAVVGGAIGGGISTYRGKGFLVGAGWGADIGSIIGGIAAPIGYSRYAQWSQSRAILSAAKRATTETLFPGGINSAVDQFDDELVRLFEHANAGELQGIYLDRLMKEGTRFDPKDLAIYFKREADITGRVLGEEVQHAIDFAMGARNPASIMQRALLQTTVEDATRWWHRRVFTRLLQNIDSGSYGLSVLRPYMGEIYSAYTNVARGRLPLNELLTRKFSGLY